MKTYFAIKRKSDSALLPVNYKGGQTHSELSQDAPPRLFNSEPAAKRALKWWLTGRVVRKYNSPLDTMYESYTFKTYNAPERKSEDFIIVKLQLNEVILRD